MPASFCVWLGEAAPALGRYCDALQWWGRYLPAWCSCEHLLLLHGETKWWGAWWGISEWLDAGVNSLAGRRHFDLVECICGEKANHLGGGFGIEVLVIAAAHTRHRLKSVYMDYVADVRPSGPVFPRMVARWVGISPASGLWAGRRAGQRFFPR